MTKFKQESSRSKPFLWTREEWDENVEKTTVKTETGKVKIDPEMVILKGIETPEQFMLWLKDYEDKILHNTKTSLLDSLNVLKRIVSKEAQVTVMNAVSLFEKSKKMMTLILSRIQMLNQVLDNTQMEKLLNTLMIMILIIQPGGEKNSNSNK
jgi:hypothetical protein